MLKTISSVTALFALVFLPLCADINLEENADEFVISTKQIIIPGYPHAFNPSLVRYKGRLLMSFRVLLNLKQKFTSTIGLVWLDDELNLTSEPVILSFRDKVEDAPIRIDDVRLVDIGGKIYLVYSDNPHPILSRGGFRVYIAELDIESLSLHNKQCLENFPGEDSTRREKNWVPFDFQQQMLLAYSIEPHLIFEPLSEDSSCRAVATTSSCPPWKLGELRGGTPAVLEGERYIAFFHSSINMASIHTEGKNIAHYFMGAYSFSCQPPFKIEQISKRFITAEKFYSGPSYEPYWKPVKVVFPCGLVSDKEHFLVSYGRDDHECWIATLLKSKLMESLVNLE
jgi:predicted GH43/DUF377 family glycosyl hydrolase